jgi:flavodoxin
MEIQELKALIKESMREVLREERLILCKILMPYVDDTEQAELEAEFGSPTDYAKEENFDMTDWVKHGNQVS